MSNLTNQYANGLNDFVEEMTTILHEGALPLYRSRHRYPIDQESLYLVALEATAFYDRYMGLVPTTEQVSRVLPEEGSYQLVQAAYERYEGSQQVAVNGYCQKINSIIDGAALRKAETAFVITPDYRSFSSRILEYLRNKKTKVLTNL
ncbi:MAG: hypothetical protein BWY98_00124 [Tenericutes bacterium ADurb.BinA155]|nr:MAG: hypothetical protein BWY98_00124 [Tenericutes bacterium ADurb.BinA155]